jgi:signal transduction histidine kinase
VVEVIEPLLTGILHSLPQVSEPMIMPRLSIFPADAEANPLADQSALIVPIGSNGRRLGMLLLVGREDERPFDINDLNAIRLLAEHAAAAIERARMFDQAEMSNERAREQLLQIREVLDNLPAGVLVIQPPDGWIQMTNDTAMEMIFGDVREHASIPVVFRDFSWEGVDGQELPRASHPGMVALQGQRVGNRQITMVTANGDRIPMLVQSAPVLSSQNEVVGAVVVFQDVSRMRAAEQIKDDFLSLISHEFRTPLTAIHGGAFLLEQQWHELDEETRRELLHDISTESSRLDRMLGNLLSVAEIMAGRFQGGTEPIVVEPLVRELIDEMDGRSPNHTLIWEADGKLPLAEGDPAWLSQIMRNLYENAIKYSPGGGEIRTTAHCEGDWVRIHVKDHGLGILPEHVPHVFERFRRPGADPTVRGMGLGLYLSRLLVDAMGGRIHAESGGPGQGSTFTVELPVVADVESEDVMEGTLYA